MPAGFNGGQTPDIIVHGERGFKNMYVLLTLSIASIERIGRLNDDVI